MKLIEKLIENRTIKSPNIIEAFRAVKRKDFLLPGDIHEAQIDAPIPIGYGQTNSQPTTIALMMELLQPGPGDNILDVGCGSGWTTALLAHITGLNGNVYGVDIIKELTLFAEMNISKYNFIKKGVVRIFCSDGWSGLTEFSPFDKILVSAAAEVIPPKLKEQLKVGGRIVIPVGKQFNSHDMYVIDKIDDNKFEEQIISGFVFVPLIKK